MQSAPAKSTVPLALYPHFVEAQKERRPRDPEDGDKLFPMRLSAIITSTNKGGLIGFRWMDDDRSLRKFETKFNKDYEEAQTWGTLRLANEVLAGTTYVAFLDIDIYHGYFRCQVLNSHALSGPKQLVLLDYGVIIDVEPGTVDLYFHHHGKNTGPDRYAFAGFCYLADKNQCDQIGAAEADKFFVGEEVELFLLSAQEPYYAIASSLRNAESKLIEASLVQDLSPEFAETWNWISMNLFDVEAAVRPTMAFSPKWIHDYNPVLVTVPHIQSLEKVAVSDLLCSLRSCILSEYLFSHYSKPEVQQALKVKDPMVELGVGVIVVAYDVTSHKYYRAQITDLNPISNYASLVGLDSPNWVSGQHSFDNLWLLSKTIEILPRQFHNVSIKRGLGQPFVVKEMLAGLARSYCLPHSVAWVQYKEKTLDVEFKTQRYPMLMLLGLQDETRYRYEIETFKESFNVMWLNKKTKEAELEKERIKKMNEREAKKKEEEAKKAAEAEKTAETQKPVEAVKTPENQKPVGAAKTAGANKKGSRVK